MTLDPTVLAQLEELDRETGGGLVDELVALFLDGTPERLRTLRAGLTAGDLGVVTAQSHSIRGSCASLGATRLAKLCSDLERSVRAGGAARPPDGLSAQVDLIEQEFHEAAKELIVLRKAQAG
jgi:HPt (histidine-containing phosphotransfer) domain-containing protein